MSVKILLTVMTMNIQFDLGEKMMGIVEVGSPEFLTSSASLSLESNL